MSPAELESLTIPALLAATVARQGDQPALGTISQGTLVWRSWNDLAALAAQAAEALAARGVQPGDRVAQLSPNCEGWIVADLAIQQLGAVHVPLHAALAPQQAAEQVTHAGARLLLVDRDETADRLRAAFTGELEIATHAELFNPPPSKGGARGGILAVNISLHLRIIPHLGDARAGKRLHHRRQPTDSLLLFAAKHLWR